MAVVNTSPSDTPNILRQNVNSIANDFGEINSLTTTDKSSAVNALEDVYDRTATGSIILTKKMAIILGVD